MNPEREDLSQEKTRDYYCALYRLDKSDHLYIWIGVSPNMPGEGSSDVVETNGQGKMLVFKNMESLKAYAASSNLPPIDLGEPIPQRLDETVRWLKLKKMKRARQLNCDDLLSAWNLFDDVCRSIGVEFDSDKERTDKIYQKLYWGTNPKVFTPPGCVYIPLWSTAELRIIHEVLSQGLKAFREATR